MLGSWREYPHCQVPVVRARVEEIARRCTGPNVLEVGCNEGWVAKAIMEERGFNVTAVDNRQYAVDESKKNFDIDVVIADANKLPFPDNSFDCVLGCELLEHLSNSGIGLAELMRVSKRHVIVTLPIGEYWLGETTHAWELNGCVIEHDRGEVCNYNKHVFLIEFFKRREIINGQYVDIVR